MMNSNDKPNTDMNRDPITGAPGSHPIGTGVGSTAGAIAGATVGAIGGPVGMVVGGAIGAVVGGLGGSAAGEAVNPTAESEYWKSAYASEPYHNKSFGYEDYAPAYEYGYQSRNQYAGKSFDQVEDKLAADWESSRGQSKMAWSDAKQASRAAWHRVERAMPGDADGDGI